MPRHEVPQGHPQHPGVRCDRQRRADPGCCSHAGPATSGQSVDEACGLVVSQLKSFSENTGANATTEQKKAMADATIKMLNSPEITNPDVKEAASNVAAVLTDTVNCANKHESNPGDADQNEAAELLARLTTSMQSLSTLCPALLED